MSATTPTRPSSWIPWLFVGGFMVVLIANGALLYYALQSWTGIETDSAYDKGVNFNEQIDSAEAQARLGWRSELTFEPRGERRARVTLLLEDSAGAALEQAEVVASFVRPTQEGHDLSLVLSPLGEGRYGAEAELPLAGQWDLKVEVEHRRGQYRLSERVQVP